MSTPSACTPILCCGTHPRLSDADKFLWIRGLIKWHESIGGGRYNMAYVLCRIEQLAGNPGDMWPCTSESYIWVEQWVQRHKDDRVGF